jgi:hypothetical protein
LTLATVFLIPTIGKCSFVLQLQISSMTFAHDCCLVVNTSCDASRHVFFVRLFELAQSCNAEAYDSSFDMAALLLPSAGCKCPTAAALLANGTIECATVATMSPPACPYNCPVCEVCVVVSGCPNIYS